MIGVMFSIVMAAICLAVAVYCFIALEGGFNSDREKNRGS